MKPVGDNAVGLAIRSFAFQLQASFLNYIRPRVEAFQPTAVCRTAVESDDARMTIL